MRDLINKLTPRILDETSTNQLLNFQTDTYKIYYLETCTGIRLVLQTDVNTNININTTNTSATSSKGAPSTTITIDPLVTIYRLYVDLLVKNPLYELGSSIECALFIQKFEQFIESLSYFN
jgi:hypothetical protein